MRTLLLVLVVMLSIGTASAMIEPTATPDRTYNLGSHLSAAYILSGETGFSGLFSVELICQDSVFTYFITPLTLGPVPEQMDAPPLKFPENARGVCTVKGNILSFGAEVIESHESVSFVVTGDIPLVVKVNNTRPNPGDHLAISVSISDMYTPSATNVRFRLADEIWNMQVTSNNIFTLTKVPDDLPADKYTFAAKVSDERGNIGENFTRITVPSVASGLVLSLGSTHVHSDESFRFFAEVVDQSGRQMDAPIYNQFLDGDKAIYERAARSGEVLTFSFPNTVSPGVISWKSTTPGFSEQETITVLPTARIEKDLAGSMVTIRNKGNIDFDGPLVVNVTKEGEEKMIQREIFLAPTESYPLDLSRELSEGTYDVVVSAGGIAAYESVPIIDLRPATTKAVQGLSSLTGAVVAAPGKTGSIMVLVVIVLAVALFLFKRKKKPKQSARITDTYQAKEPERLDERDKPEVKKFVEDQLKGR